MMDDTEVPEPFEIVEPEQLSSPLVFSSPHSGNIYPPAFVAKAQLDVTTLRRSEDAYVDELFSCAPSFGAPLLRARFPRAYLDLNREPYELDPRMFEDALPSFANVRSLRVAAGLGTVPRVVADAKEIYRGKLRIDEALHRIETLYKPYHSVLKALLERARSKFGIAVLVDCHSMPSALARDHGAGSKATKKRSDFVIGDRFGASCNARIVETIEERLRSQGYAVQRNRPYAGGFITEHYGRPGSGHHAVQIEIARDLYMDESNLQKCERFESLARHLNEVVADLAREVGTGDNFALERRAAAE